MNEENKHGTYNTLFHWQSFRLKLVIEGIIVGALAGLVVVFYRLAVEKAWELTKSNYFMKEHNISSIILWFILSIIISLIIGNMVKKEPMISGSGIPQVEGVLLRKLKMNWLRVIIGKFIGGVLAIGGGLSLGREGPSIQLGAAVGQGFSRIFKRVKVEEKYLITSGASAGLSAAFNAPLSGVIFALEEVHKNFSPLILISAMSASLTADFISKQFFGLRPVFDFQLLNVLPLKYYVYLIVLGVITGVFGVLYNKAILKTQDLYGKFKWLTVERRPIVPFMVAGILGLILPEALGSGHELITKMISENWTLKILIIILVVKFLFIMISFGSGVPGGIFLPLLVIGAITGGIYGNILVNTLNISHQYVNNFIILAMAGYFTAIVRAPITGSILITEMTGSFSHLLSLTVVSITAYIVADMLGSEPIYESLLERFITKNDKEEHRFVGDSKKKVILEIAVCMDTIFEDKKIKDIDWPSNCLLVGVKRGQKEIIPKGNTTIYAGDYLIVLVDEDKAPQVTEVLLNMAGTCLVESCHTNR
ncbi:H(+)/Cl(-) exchange transporter ClcA [Clostridium bovifaecis]|uniref:H(+)/Cl(-) exchange transporter ClcA n=1 Tax=Clostridium bovifaecis TaxID=2184719 RepID=A0A6I6F0R7_9CLOT|nr:H(+)/Cl(-) exchange transporter ClcA [Clostridium bovifaecis]